MFCEHHDDEVFTRTRAALRDVLHVASELYIGRTGHPERRLLEHRSDADRDHLTAMAMPRLLPVVHGLRAPNRRRRVARPGLDGELVYKRISRAC